MVLAYVGYGLLGVIGVYLLLLVAAALSADPRKTYERPSAFCRFLLDVTVRMLMFFGRVGGLTLIYAAFSGHDLTYARYPQEKITVG